MPRLELGECVQVLGCCEGGHGAGEACYNRLTMEMVAGRPGAKPEREDAGLGELRAALLGWYRQHKRELPWRQDTDAYRVWVSEIMLQQTRVAAVLEHYRKFLDRLPTLEALAAASEQQVLALWSGLGYYRRARMLHRAAQVVVADLGGEIPRDAENLRRLPGVGRYTAAALASICFGEPVAVVDGNVERVLSRVDGEPRADAPAWKRAQELLDCRHPGDWNQAMMELGATVCTPQNPQCLVCPIHAWCRTLGAETSKPRTASKRVQTTRALIERRHCVYLVQRPADAGKMAGMWELPEIAASVAEQRGGRREERNAEQKNAEQKNVRNTKGEDPADPTLAKRGKCGAPERSEARRKNAEHTKAEHTKEEHTKAERGEKELCVVRHCITDTNYEVRVVSGGLKALGARDKKAGRWVPREELWELALTGLTRKILRKQGLR